MEQEAIQIAKQYFTKSTPFSSMKYVREKGFEILNANNIQPFISSIDSLLSGKKKRL